MEWSIEGIDKQEENKNNLPVPITTDRARNLLTILKSEHNFDVVLEIVTLYKEADLLEDALEKIKIKKAIIKELIKFCFPVMSAQSSEKEKSRINFNFTLQQNNGNDKFDGVVDANYEEED